jgi:AcrR family transcriptional regulator
VPTDVVLTERTRETYESLLAAAREVFELEGYDRASISSIVEAAGVARGTFYIYFESKEDIFLTVAQIVEDEIKSMQFPIDVSDLIGVERAARIIRTSTERFLKFYRERVGFMAVLEQVASQTPEFTSLRLRMRRASAERAIILINGLKAEGLVSTSLDARYAAVALTGMVDRFAYVWLVLGEDFELDRAVETLTRLWFQASTGLEIDSI